MGQNKNLTIGLLVVLALVLGVIWINSDKGTQIENQTEETVKETENTTTSQPAGSKTTATKTATQSERYTIYYTDKGFFPSVLETEAGKSVKFINASSKGLWVASNPYPTKNILPSLDQGKTVAKGGIFEYTFTTSGTFTYHNYNNPNHTGTVKVK